jgi:hypothetical protein
MALRHSHKMLVRRSQVKKLLKRPRNIRENNIKINVAK